MKNINNSNTPSVTMGIFAHANAGKTTLTEQLLYRTKVTDIIGKVDTGNTITDSMNIEKERGISVRSSLVTFDLNGKKVQLIDTPGHIDFSAEVERSLNVLDSAVVVISGVEGIEAQTYTLWRLLKEKKIPTIIFINKMDRVGADFQRIIRDIKNKIEKNIIPLIDIDKINDDYEIKNIEFYELGEILANFDEEILDNYLETPDNISKELIEKKLEELIKNAELFPVIGGSALRNDGIDKFISTLDKYLPETLFCNDKVSGLIYLVRFEDGKKNYYVKILSGELSLREDVVIDDGIRQKIKGIYKIEGSNTISVDKASAGEIVIINGIDAKTDQYIGEKPDNFSITKFVNPLINMSVISKGKSSSGELMKALSILYIEDPNLNVRYDKNNNQIIISLMGEIQAEIIKTLLKERFNIDSEFKNPVLIHKETPSKTGLGLASYTSVSAIQIEVNPLSKGSGVVFNSKLSTDYLLKKYQNQAEKLIKNYLKQGVYGWELTDAEICIVDGRFDSMGSDPMHFNIAVPLAFMRALKNSNVKIIEPIAEYSIIIPKEHLSATISSLSKFNSSFEILENNSEKATIKGEAKYSNMLNYSKILVRITSGLGVFSSHICRYEPSYNQDIEKTYIGPDPRNETVFLINDMKGSFEALDRPITKKKKESSSKFKRKKKEEMYAKKR